MNGGFSQFLEIMFVLYAVVQDYDFNLSVAMQGRITQWAEWAGAHAFWQCEEAPHHESENLNYSRACSS